MSSLEFHICTHKTKYFLKEENLELEEVNMYRQLYIEKLIAKQVDEVKAMTEEKRKARKREMIVAVHDAWLDKFMESCGTVSFTDKGCFTGATLVNFLTHTVWVLPRKSTIIDNNRMKTDFFGLCWLYNFQTKTRDIGRDIIVSYDGWRYFLCMLIGIEFYALIKSNEYMREYIPDFNIADIIVVHHDYNYIWWPQTELLDSFAKNCIKVHPRLSSIPNDFSL